MKFILTIFISSVVSSFAFGQKGTLYAYWGWNTSAYTHSDIHFKGENYDFTLDKVKAKDRQTKFDPAIYFNPGFITIPQTNVRIGYQYNDHFEISLGIDHMKYVVQQDQTVNINGIINRPNDYNGIYNNESIKIQKGFLAYEHTDGLNYINVALRRMDTLFILPTKITSLDLTYMLGAETGVMVPKTNVTLMDELRNDKFYLSGYGVSAIGGIRLTAFKHFFIQTEFKGGFIHLPRVRTTMYSSDLANQHFGFLQHNILIGGSVNLQKKAKEVDLE